MVRRVGLGRLTAALLLGVVVGTSGCLLVPVPPPIFGPPVVVAPRPAVVIHGRKAYGSYHPYRHHHRGYGWR